MRSPYWIPVFGLILLPLSYFANAVAYLVQGHLHSRDAPPSVLELVLNVVATVAAAITTDWIMRRRQRPRA